MKKKSKNPSNKAPAGSPAIKSPKSKIPAVKSTIANLHPPVFPIVGIGASAGGLEALELFFGAMPKATGMAFVVIQHLDPNHAGIMPELLQRITAMKVFQASDGLRVMPNCVYVIPPNKSLSILSGVLHLFLPVESHGLRLPVDFFFRSLAADRQDKSIGIILSGMGSDGTLGLKAIKEKNGIVLVQEPQTAKFDGMPKSALSAVIADIVAPAEDLPAKLLAFLKVLPAIITGPDLDGKAKNNIDKIIILLREQTGHDFSLYKKNTLLRRIERRKNLHQLDKIQNYVRLLQENPGEVEILYKEILIGVTRFFRDHAVWDKLKEIVLPALLSELPNGHVVRAWVTACSSGEEAYSLAIIFKEILDSIKPNKYHSLQIFATDLDNDAIEVARRGIFSSNIVADVSPGRLNRFFTAEGDGFRVNAAIREMVVFAPQDVIKDPPFTRLDILTCRNMLIYMEPELQKKLLSLFKYSLNPGGIMVLGTAETLDSNADSFEELDARYKIYKRDTSSTGTELNDFPSSFFHKRTAIPGVNSKPAVKVVENIQTIADQILLQKFSPASVLVNSSGDILYITGRTGKYLEPSSGKANWNIYAMARDGLRSELPGIFRKALQHYDPVIIRSIKVGINGGTQFVDVTVQRIENPEAVRGMIMIVFTDVPAVVAKTSVKGRAGKQLSSARQKEMEIEQRRSHEEIQSIREEMQTSQEELTSTNEELQSTNEELQSTNEELTTSKEEMQSLNEELQTVNVELQSKVSDYVKSNDDMKNLLNSTEIATLFLDKDLNIRRFTDPVVKLFKVRPADIGRPFTDLVSELQYAEIGNNAKQVLKTLVPIETAISATSDRWFTVRIMPYRTTDDRIDGLVLTFTDISVAKKLEQELTKANELLRGKGKKELTTEYTEHTEEESKKTDTNDTLQDKIA